jgi:hypothetical protein
MNFRVTVCVAAMTALAGCSSSSGVYRWVPFMPSPKKNQSQAALAKVDNRNPFGPITGPVYYGLEMRVSVVPGVIRLGDTRALEVHLVLINRSKKPANLMFNAGNTISSSGMSAAESWRNGLMINRSIKRPVM